MDARLLSCISKFLLVACIATSPLWAATDPFVGQWKLNPSKSKLTDQMKVESVSGNKYLVDVGSGPEMSVIDGPDQPRADGSTVHVTSEGPDVWKIVQKNKDGSTLLTATWTLSKDGNSLTDDLTSFGQDGSPSNVKYVYKRAAGGGSGFAGTWVSTSETVNSVYTIQIKPYEGGLSLTTPGGTKNTKFDGKSVRRLSASALEIVSKSNGKITQTQQFKVSPDLKTLTITVHSAGKDVADILVFDRQ